MEKRHIVIFIILLLLYKLLYSKKEYLNDNIKISIIIPFIKRDTAYLYRCMKDQRRQSLKPYEIIVAGEIPNKSIQNEIINEFDDLNIIFINSGSRTPAGINRNLGADNAKGDIYLFTDVDDIYHPKRNEVVTYVFNKYNPLFLGYHYTMKNKIFSKLNNLSDLKFKDMDNIYKCTFAKDKPYPNAICCSSGYIHNGHVAVHKDVFKKLNNRYSVMERGQDSEFNSRLLKKLKLMNVDKNKFLVVVEYLSFYITNKVQSMKK